MQLLSVEYLSLAAESTVILLLLAFAWPKKKTEPVALETGEALSWEPTKFHYLQSCLHRGLYLQQWSENHCRAAMFSAAPEPFVPREIEVDKNRPSLPLPWQDRLTRLLNRHGFDEVVNAWLAIDPKHRSESCMAMITLSKYYDLVGKHGAMVTERALQRIANHIAVSSSGQALVARYLPDRFVLLYFASRLVTCQGALKSVLESISGLGFFEVAGEPVSLPCNISIVSIGSGSDLASTMDALEEGSVEAENSGRSIISLIDGIWTDEPNLSEPPMPNETEVREESIEQISEEMEKPNECVPATVRNTFAEMEPDQDEKDITKANDISAVADASDIAALLIQIDKSNSLHEVQKPIDDNPVKVDVGAIQVQHDVDPTGVAIAEDTLGPESTICKL